MNKERSTEAVVGRWQQCHDNIEDGHPPQVAPGSHTYNCVVGYRICHVEQKWHFVSGSWKLDKCKVSLCLRERRKSGKYITIMCLLYTRNDLFSLWNCYLSSCISKVCFHYFWTFATPTSFVFPTELDIALCSLSFQGQWQTGCAAELFLFRLYVKSLFLPYLDICHTHFFCVSDWVLYVPSCETRALHGWPHISYLLSTCFSQAFV